MRLIGLGPSCTSWAIAFLHGEVEPLLFAQAGLALVVDLDGVLGVEPRVLSTANHKYNPSLRSNVLTLEVQLRSVATGDAAFKHGTNM